LEDADKKGSLGDSFVHCEQGLYIRVGGKSKAPIPPSSILLVLYSCHFYAKIGLKMMKNRGIMLDNKLL